MRNLIFVVLLIVACASASKIGDKLKLKPRTSFPTGRIVEGQDAIAHAAPYIVSLNSNFTTPSHRCGGTLIDKNWILTAAHCINNPVGMAVIAGLHKRTNYDARTQSREVDFGRIHESYRGGVGPFDIALLHVAIPFEFNEWVQPAFLPTISEIHVGETHVYGWGQPDAYNNSGAVILQTVTTEVVEWTKCKSVLPEDAPLAESNICSDALQKGISACNGDSGGPLVIERKGGVPSELIGIVSWGYVPCGVKNMPSVYTRVSAYIDWVVKIQNAYYILY